MNEFCIAPHASQSTPHVNMRFIGLVGGVASGKSMVARQFAQLGAGLLDADRAAHEVLRLPRIEAAAAARWGSGIFGPDGHIDRAGLARIVFAPPPEGPRQREYLEQLIHPEVHRLLLRQADAMAAAGMQVAVLDVPLLLEAGWAARCEPIVYVDAPRATRLARAVARGWSEEEFAAREAAQKSLDCKKQAAGLAVDNSGSPEQTRAQVERIWRGLVAL
jgi:dephospho-CoA kinase